MKMGKNTMKIKLNKSEGKLKPFSNKQKSRESSQWTHHARSVKISFS